MGEVYKARDTRLDRTVAVKVLPEHIAKRDDLRARFEREARAGAVCAGQRSKPRAVEVFQAAAQNPLTSIPPEHLVEMADGRRRSLTLRLPVQMVPELVRQLAQRNVAVYHVQLLED